MKTLLALIFLLVAQTSYAALDFTSLRVFPGFSPVLTKPEQVKEMQISCAFRDQSKLFGTIQVDAQNSQKLGVTFQYQNTTQKFLLSTRKGNIKSVDISLGNQELKRDGLGSGPNPWIMIWGDRERSLSLELYFWFGNFQMIHSGKTITMTSEIAPFTYVDRPVYDANPGQCIWKIALK